tara:strand:+ start:2586 stop:4157 length:1572 start_codon:yes stop_codon:yes gene_type:complete
MNLALEALSDAGVLKELKFIKRGIEKESLRIDSNGSISSKKHPHGLGSALTNSFITTDFSEALLELVTPTFTNAQECLNFLTELHAFVHRSIDRELLWPLSMPCSISSDEEIPIGNYGSSNPGMMKYAYRKGLSYRYGSKMQAIAGIHYNFSFPDEFFKKIATLKNLDSKNLKDIKNESYLRMARNFKRYEWLYFLLFGASPALSDTFTNQEQELDGFKTLSKGSLFRPHATSLRMGNIGYISEIQDDLNISINSIEEYLEDLKKALITPHAEYKGIGEFLNGERIQINSSVIQIENEYYSTIRPKRICASGERPINILKEQGIEYLELRCVDLDPFSPIGMQRDQADFLDMLLILCFLKESPPLNKKEGALLKENHKKIINFGREPGLRIFSQKGEGSVKDLAKRLLEEMAEIAETASGEIFQGEENLWGKSLEMQTQKIENLDLTPSAKLLNRLDQDNLSYNELGVKIAEENSKFFLNLGLTNENIFSKEASSSMERQKQLESEKRLPFEEYLKEFLNKVS